MPSLVTRNRAPEGMSADEPKKRLIEAGLDLFSKYSFDGASTRMLVERAEVNLASIKYYFGSKEGLYLAVAAHIVEEIEGLLGPRLAKAQEALKQGVLFRATELPAPLRVAGIPYYPFPRSPSD